MTQPDILFIMTDQQRFDTIAALGNSHIYTPNSGSAGAKGNQFFEGIRDLPGLRGRALHNPHRMRTRDRSSVH